MKELVIPAIIIKPQPYDGQQRWGSTPHTIYEERGRYVWATVIKPAVKEHLVSWSEVQYLKGSFTDLSYFRLPTTQELIDIFDPVTKECRVFGKFFETVPGTPYWTGESIVSPGDSHRIVHVVTPDREFSARWEVEVGFPLFVHVNEPTPMKRLIQPFGV